MELLFHKMAEITWDYTPCLPAFYSALA